MYKHINLFKILYFGTLVFCIAEMSAFVSINGKVIDSSQPIIIKENNTVKNLRGDLQGVLTNKKDNYINRIRNKKLKK